MNVMALAKSMLIVTRSPESMNVTALDKRTQIVIHSPETMDVTALDKKAVIHSQQTVVCNDSSLSHLRQTTDSMPTFKKMKLAPSPICSCGLEDRTAEHKLQRCPLQPTARTNVRPTAVQLHTKLYDSKKELEKTTTFILQTGLSEQQRSRKRRSMAEDGLTPFYSWVI